MTGKECLTVEYLTVEELEELAGEATQRFRFSYNIDDYAITFNHDELDCKFLIKRNEWLFERSYFEKFGRISIITNITFILQSLFLEKYFTK